MPRRTVSWTQALRDLEADRATPAPVREERLRSMAGLRGTPAMALSAWRGRSGRRYVVTIVDALDPETPAVVIAVARDPAGVAVILAVGTVPGFTAPASATELHVHRLAETPAERIAIMDDLAPMTVADALTALLDLYAAPGTWSRDGTGEDGTWDLEAALYRVVGDPDADGISEGEAGRREALASGVFSACGVDLMAFNDAARHQGVVVAVLRAGLDHAFT